MSHDHPSPWSPSGQQGWPPAPQPTYAPEPPPQPFTAPVAAPPIEVRLTGQPSSGRGLAITGVVLGGLGLVAGGMALVVALALGFMGDPGGGSYGIRGSVTPTGGTLTGTVLADEVSRRITDDGGAPEDVTCPATVKVAQDVTAVCHGKDYGDDATFVVFFEDDRGAFTLLEV